ncbi:hypothetical protein [Actinoplanes friuliensis]|uniref:Uncharacterized protein n=1 Tax=Actinoplanes friuliensis DSM 7358 TaxID=1246995 RepID=U5WFL1_9ACTN|nr:hypothetical protein [Actinoplanes friuliensis]AGZ46711.1 hypothetical protein AFR_42285 [Actinoplanes friuliensis DSM 7358]
MTTFWIGIGVSIITGALVNEFCDVAPWLAALMVRLAARLWSVGEHEVAAAYEEEWTAVITDCPGKLTKVIRAAGFLSGAAWKASRCRIGAWKPRRRATNEFVATYRITESTAGPVPGRNLKPGDLMTIEFANRADYRSFLRKHPHLQGMAQVHPSPTKRQDNRSRRRFPRKRTSRWL